MLALAVLILGLAGAPILDAASRSFRRGDADQDGRSSLGDAIGILSYLFAGGRDGGCLAALDVNGDGGVAIADALSLLQYLFLDGLKPPAPFDACGPDPNRGHLGCDSFAPCPADGPDDPEGNQRIGGVHVEAGPVPFEGGIPLGGTFDPIPQEVLNEVKSYIDSLGVKSLHELGTVRFSMPSGFTEMPIEPGLYVLDLETKSSLLADSAAFQAPAGWVRHSTQIKASVKVAIEPAVPVQHVPVGGRVNAAALGGGGQFNQAALGSLASAQVLEDITVVRFEGTELIDRAVFLANRIVFDSAHLTLVDNITEFYLVAETIVVEGPSEITWEHADTAALGRPSLGTASSGRKSFSPTQISSGTAEHAQDGENGEPGDGGTGGNSGLDAPDVYVIARRFEPCASCNALPDFNLRGQEGGEGQEGQNGQSGGNGAKGSPSEPGLAWCEQQVGYGGDGGNGGRGGDGGNGGAGGDGGNLLVQYVEAAAGTLIGTKSLARGQGGEGGDGGNGGAAGEGGEAGDPDGILCFAHWNRGGDDGVEGQDGRDEDDGSDGTKGTLDQSLISYEEWEQAFTQPYLVTVSDRAPKVGTTIRLETYNLTGEVTLNYKDFFTGEVEAETIHEVEPNVFEWTIPEVGFVSSRLILTLIRDHDYLVSNEYSIEVQPKIMGIWFAGILGTEDLAIPGATALLYGHGLRPDCDIIIDEVNLGPGTLAPWTDEDGELYDAISFVVPVPSETGRSLFSSTDGVTEQKLWLRPPYPLDDTRQLGFTLKKTRGLIYRPSQHSYSFTNGAVSSFIKTNIMKGAGWGKFREIYNPATVDAALLLSTPLTLTSYLIWRLWWETGSSACCMALSANSMNDFFNEVEGLPSLKRRDVAEVIMETQSGLLSKEILGQILGETVVDSLGNGTTASTVDAVLDFFEDGSNSEGNGAPLLAMVPNRQAYESGGTLCLLTTLLVPGPSPSITLGALATCGLLELGSMTIDLINGGGYSPTFAELVTQLGDSHVLAPFMVVYDDPEDDLPSRIYFYDSNLPSVDVVYMEISKVGDEIQFHFDSANSFSTSGGSYIYGTTSGWILANLTVSQALAQPTLLLP